MLAKRFARKPFTTALWIILCAAVSAFLLVGISMYLSTSRMAAQLDESHTAIAARIDPKTNAYGETSERHFTQTDAAWIESLDSVEAIRYHTISAASCELFQPLIEMNRHTNYQGNGDRRPYCNAVMSGNVHVGVEYLLSNGMWSQQIDLQDVYLMNPEYNSGMALAESTMRYDGAFALLYYPLDEESKTFFDDGGSFVLSGIYDPGGLLFRQKLGYSYSPMRGTLVLGGVKVENGVLIGGYDFPAKPYGGDYYFYYGSDTEEPEPETPFEAPDTIYTFPAAERVADMEIIEPSLSAKKSGNYSEEIARAAVACEQFFAETPHEIWREFLQSWKLQQGSLPVIGTDKLETMYSFLSQRAKIKEGRAFTEEEYASGAPVLLLSQQTAERAGLKVGDTLTLRQYLGAFETTGALKGLNPLRGLSEDSLAVDTMSLSYDRMQSLSFLRSVNNPTIDIFNMHQEYGPEQTFTLVGIYELEENWGDGSFDFTPNTIIMPRSTQIAGAVGEIPEEGDFYGLTFSIELINGRVAEFQAAIEASPYEGEFYTYEQGYESVQENLNANVRSMRRLLILSVLCWGFFQIFYLLMYQGSEKTTLGTMRSLGRAPLPCGLYHWCGGFIVALLGILGGSYAGYTLMERVQAGILEDALAGIDPSLADNVIEASRQEILRLFSANTIQPEQFVKIALIELGVMSLLLLVHTAWLLGHSPRKLMEG